MAWLTGALTAVSESGIIGDVIDTSLDILKDLSFLGEDTNKNLKEINSLLRRLFEKFDVFDFKNFKTNRLIIYALINKLENDNQVKGEEVSPIKMDESEFEDAKHIADFANNIYLADETLIQSNQDRADTLAKAMNLSPEDTILFTWLQKEEDDAGSEDLIGSWSPHFMIFTDKSTKSIVLAIRGTANLQDGLIDAVATDSEFLDGFAHQGVAKASKRILEESSLVLKEAFETYPGYRLIVTGHSLGAGTAILTTMTILSGSNIIDPQKTVVKCVALAPPPVYRCDSIDEKFSDHIHIFINRDDIVPRASLYTLARLFEACRRIDKACEVSNNLEIFNTLTGIQAPHQNIIDALNEADQDTFPELEHVGKVFYLDLPNTVEDRFRIHGVVKGYFSKRMFLKGFANLGHHYMLEYKKAFDNVDLEQQD